MVQYDITPILRRITFQVVGTAVWVLCLPYFHFEKRGTGAQRCLVTCSRSHSWKVTELDFNLGSPAPEFVPLAISWLCLSCISVIRTWTGGTHTNFNSSEKRRGISCGCWGQGWSLNCVHMFSFLKENNNNLKYNLKAEVIIRRIMLAFVQSRRWVHRYLYFEI